MLTCANAADGARAKELGERRAVTAAQLVRDRAQLAAAAAEDDGFVDDGIYDALIDEDGYERDESTPYAWTARSKAPGYVSYRPLWRALLLHSFLTDEDRAALAPGVTRCVARTSPTARRNALTDCARCVPASCRGRCTTRS